MAKSWKRFSTGLWEASPEQAHANVHQKNNGKKLLLPFWNRLWLLGRLKPEDLRNSFALSLAPAIILPQSILPTIIRIGKSSKDWIKWFWFGKSLFFFFSTLRLLWTYFSSAFAKLFISYFNMSLSRFCRLYMAVLTKDTAVWSWKST